MKRFKWIARKINSLSIISKLILGFLAILIPLYAFNFAVINIGKDKNRKEIYSSLSGTLHSYINLLNTEFQNIESKMKDGAVQIALLHTRISQMQLDEDGIPVPSSEKTALIHDMRNELRDLQMNSRFIKNIKLYLPQFREIISNDALDPSSFDEKQFQQLVLLAREQPSRLIYQQDGKTFLLKTYIYREKYEDGLFLITAEISDAAMRILLDGVIGYQSGGVIFFARNQTWRITTMNRNGQIADILSLYPKEPMEGQTDSPDILKPGIDYRKIDGESYIIAREYSSLLDAVLLVCARTDDIFVSLKSYNSLFIIMSLLSIVVIAAFSLWMVQIIHKPLTVLVSAFRRVENGELGFTLKYGSEDEFGYLYDSFNHMLSRLDSLIHEVYEEKIRSQHSELKRLQSQINPHFLYNSFFVLSRLIYSQDIEKASRFSSFLSRYYQFITRDAADQIRLSEEVEHARTYTEIQTICYSGRIKVDFGEIPEGFEDREVPRLILQPVVENSYKHGFENKIQGAQLQVRFQGEHEECGNPAILILSVEDNGEEISDDKILELQQRMEAEDMDMTETTGLYNVHRRIHLKYGSGSGICVGRSSLGGMKVEIIIRFPIES